MGTYELENQFEALDRTIHIFKIMNFLVQQLKNIMHIRQLRKQGHEKANIYVEHNNHPGSQIAPYKKFLTLKASGQNRNT